MKYIRHASAAFILFAIMVSLWVQSYHSLETNYNVTRTGDHDGYNVMESLDNLNLIQGMNQTLSGVYSIQNPSNVADLLGALAAVGIGILQLTAGILLFPIEIIGVLTGFYYIPPIVAIGIVLLFINYIAYILISAYTRGDL